MRIVADTFAFRRGVYETIIDRWRRKGIFESHLTGYHYIGTMLNHIKIGVDQAFTMPGGVR